MKKLLMLFMIILLSTTAHAVKIEDLDDITSPASGDVLYIVDDPTGVPAAKKISLGNLLTDDLIPDTITINTATFATSVTSDSTWTSHNDYPSACSAGQYVSGIGDTLTCGTPTDTTCDGGSCAVTNTGTLDGYEGAALLDNTDDQTIDVLSFDGVNISISLEGDGEATKTLDISSVDTDTNTNAATICTGNTTYLDGEGNCDDISSVYEAADANIIKSSEIDTFSELNTIVADATLLKGGTLTDTKYCVYDSGSASIVCDSEGGTGGGTSSWTTESIQDLVGAMTTGNTETLITVTYEDADGTLDFVVDNDLANYSWTNVDATDLKVGSVTQAYDADLTTWAGVTPSANGQSLVGAANYAAMRGLLDLEAGTDFYSIAAADTAFEGELDNSAGLRAALSDESGTGAAIFAGGNVGAGTATTPSANDNDTSIATTAYVQGEINGAGGTNLSCSGGQCNVDDAFITNNADDTMAGNLTVQNTITVDYIGSTGGTTTVSNTLEVDSVSTPSGVTFDGVTADPCSTLGEGAIFYNTTSNYFCYCDGTNDLKMNDNSTACF